MMHAEEQNIRTSELQLQLQDSNSRMKEMNHKTSIDVARLLKEERTSAEAERRNFLDQIGALYDLSLQTRWNRLQGNYGKISNDIPDSGDPIEGIATHSLVDECITKQKQFAEGIVHLRNQLKTIDNEHLSARRAVVSAQKDLQQTVANCEDGFDEPVALWAQQLETTQSHNNQLIDAYRNKSNTLEATVQQSCWNVKGQLETVLQSCGQFQQEMLLRSDSIEPPIATLEKDFCKPLSHLQESIRNPISPISASLKILSEPTNTLPQNGNGASSTSSVHEGLQDKNFHDRQQPIDSDLGGIPPWIPENPVEQP
ncbi:hypothetical protein APSETT445_005469 [Aspergillus pseudonomiae]